MVQAFVVIAVFLHIDEGFNISIELHMSMVLPCFRNYFSASLGSWVSVAAFVLGRHGCVSAMVYNGLSGASISEISVSFYQFQELQSSNLATKRQK